MAGAHIDVVIVDDVTMESDRCMNVARTRSVVIHGCLTEPVQLWQG